jgi:hypothetical protein
MPPYRNLQILIVPILRWPLVVDVSIHPGYAGGALVSAPVGLAVPSHDGVPSSPHSTANEERPIMGESSV